MPFPSVLMQYKEENNGLLDDWYVLVRSLSTLIAQKLRY